MVHASRLAVVDGAAAYTWAEFRARSRRLASALRGPGLERGDRVAFLAFNSEALLLAHFGVLQAGGVLVAINTRLTPTDVVYIVDHSGSRSVFFSPELAPALARVSPAVKRIQIGPEFESFLETGTEDGIESWLECEDDLCAIDYTFRGTGRSFTNSSGRILARFFSAPTLTARATGCDWAARPVPTSPETYRASTDMLSPGL